ncbi:winged helix-turn-helix transcriptional regulator [Prauserella shujinwangii]|uniref:winged helix-turn-helix transcriptional regulator n=1 Tax=Prauserella shujinwangii TaxID=1453103 RepID=UPI001FEC7696|nr:winged helix-turn-helix transcriptional regulator [Prauserella shujinwangii]
MDQELLHHFYDLRQLLIDKWAPAIIVTLAHGKMRRADILTTINSFTYGEEWTVQPKQLQDSILSRTLKRMTEEGLLVRTQEDLRSFPAEVYYSLSPEMEEFLTVVEPAAAWARRHADLLARAKAHRRQTEHGDADQSGGVGADSPDPSPRLA